MIERFEVDKKTKLKDGKFERLNADGSKFEVSNYEQDVLQGERTLYFESGTAEIVEQYKDGVLDGPYITNYEEGSVKLEGQYEEGVMTGIWKQYYESGQVMEEVTFRDNMENGPFVEYHPNGNLKAEGQYQDGDKEQGLLKLYDENGELYKRMECDNGICRTVWSREDQNEESND